MGPSIQHPHEPCLRAVLWRAGGTIPDSLVCLTALTRLDVHNWAFGVDSTFPFACLETLRHLSLACECCYKPSAQDWWANAAPQYADHSFQQLTSIDFRHAYSSLPPLLLLGRHATWLRWRMR